jgi:3-oxoacyl-[acyl-carrier-protein] synthase II
MNPHPEHNLFPGDKKIVVTGVGAVCSIGSSVPEIWDGLLSGKSGSRPIQGFDAAGFGPAAAQVQDLPATKTDISPQLAKTMGKHLSLLLKSAGEAFEHSGIQPGTFPPGDAGFFAGMGMVDYSIDDLLPAVRRSLTATNDLDYDNFFSRGYQEIYPLWPLGMLNNVAFCQAAIHFGLQGENCVFSPHGDAGVLALYEAVQVLREGRAKFVAAGGVSEEISPLSIARARLKGVIANRCEPDQEKVNNSVFLGECGAMLILEPLSLAGNRGVKPMAEICGFGFSCEMDTIKGCVSTRAVSSSMQAAFSDAGIGPDNIDLVILGGAGHENALEAVQSVFNVGDRAPVVLTSRQVLGEMYAAAPVMDAIIGMHILASSQIPKALAASLNGNISTAAQVRRGTARVLVHAAGYEGQSASLIIERPAGL